MARRASVTVSMAADSTGSPSLMLRVSVVERSTSRGSTVEWAGTRRTSSKVRASSRIRMSHSTHAPGRVNLQSAIPWGYVRNPGTQHLHRLPAEREVRLLLERGWPSSGWKRSCRISPSRPPGTVFHLEGQGSADPRGHVPPAQYEPGVHAPIRPTGVVRGRVSLYEPRGDYQMIVDHMEEAGSAR